ncbi:MAG TPA: VOC family protein [Novosphingobium sp.]|nr:VOC family protein [Novosphingobium sp.]
MPDTARANLPRINGAYVMFYYHDMAQAARWYADVVGLEPWMTAPGLALFRLNAGACLALVQDGSGSQRAIEGANKGAILSIETDALEAWHARLFAQGVEGTGHGLQVGCDGMTIEFKVRDPGGYTVEFFEWIE